MRKNIHEANITAELYFQLRSKGFDVELEFSTPVGRIDLIVWHVRNESVRIGVEVKKDDYKDQPFAKHVTRYAKLLFPIVLCVGRRAIVMTIMRIESHQSAPVAMSEIDSVPLRPRKARLTRSERLLAYANSLDEGVNFRI